MDKTIKFGKRHSLWLFLPVLLILLSACSKETDGSEPDPTNVPVKFSLDIVSPEMGSTVLASIAGGNDIDTRFYSRMNEGTSRTVLIKQEGKIINLGSCPVTLSNTAGTEGRIEVDGTDKVEANKPYDVYVLGCGARWEDGEVFYKGEMSRGSGFYTWAKFSSAYRPTKATMNICGTGELLFVINKSGAPIKFRHKGFSASEKWYYKYAEVSTSSGNVVNSEDGEVESEARDVPVFTGNNARSIYSVYVPNGKKIQDAQLIAEINGVEVRSSNRISSDVTLQTNQSYAMFAVWDGETLQLGDGEGDPVVIVCSDTNSGVIVNEVRSDGTVVLSSGSTTVPKPGDIIVSGVTGAAPNGFLYHVESVRQSGGQVTIKTSVACLNEVLPNAHVSERMSFREAQFAKEFAISDNTGRSFYIGDVQKNEHVRGTARIGFSIGGDFIYDSNNNTANSCGIVLNGVLTVNATLETCLKNKFEKTLGTDKLDPVTVVVNGIPVVLSPEVQYQYRITPNGYIDAKWKPITFVGADYSGRLVWSREKNSQGENWSGFASSISDFSDWTVSDYFMDMVSSDALHSGDTEFEVRPEVSFRFYNSDAVSFAVGLSAYTTLTGDVSLKWKANDWNWDDYLLKDDVSLSAGIRIPFKGRLEFMTDGSVMSSEKTLSSDLLGWHTAEGTTLLPQFKDLKISPESNVLASDKVHVSAKKGASQLTVYANYEDDFGFCISQVKKDGSGNELPMDWTFHSLKSAYSGGSSGSGNELKIELDIQTSDLQGGATYEVRPYTVMKFEGKKYVFKRHGGRFSSGSSVGSGGGTITDAHGEDM